MIFNSLEFVLFFIVFFVFYWIIFKENLKAQNSILLIASYVFISWVDVRFLMVLICSSIVNYFLGIAIAKAEENEKKQKILLRLGLLYGLGVLGYFKYYNFFISGFVDILNAFNLHTNVRTLSIILPLGISFYTFKSLSYILDVESGKTEPVKNWLTFFTYMAFFPNTLSGPIDKARDFVPQLEKKRIFSEYESIEGLKQILWGLFKKVVIANNCGLIATNILDDYGLYTANTVLLGIFMYTIELYADFSGYSDMAVGIARILGFKSMNNFRYPFFAQNIAAFWQRWHISLTIWLTEYVFTPLAFVLRAYGKAGTIIAIIINFILVGLWHGDSFTFVVYGFLHGCYFIPLILKGTINTQQTIAEGRSFFTLKEFFQMATTFVIVMLTLVIFDAQSMAEAINIYKAIFSSSLFVKPRFPLSSTVILSTLVYILFMFIIEWIGRNHTYPIEKMGYKWVKGLRWGFYYILIMMVIFYLGKEQQFIYFQF